ncbi:hypothetical protein MK805_06340 [Shimazuella sp. AN120528]|nr:hypothetical protein [Shimazuella soli]MCH5584587.1 hypothetical protein [Shimazuella soli]
MDRIIRPIPVCNCFKEKMLQEEREKELVEQRARVRRIYGEGFAKSLIR